MSPDSPIIQAVNLSVGYGRKVIRENLNFSLQGGMLTCVLGPNGEGKSTLLKTIAGLIPALEGQITVGGIPLKKLSRRELASKISVVLTEGTLAGGLTTREVISLGRYQFTNFFGRLDEKNQSTVDSIIRRSGLQQYADTLTGELSDGCRQKVMIAKSIAQESAVIILDEPTAFLDITSRLETMELLATLAHEKGKAILLSTHDLDTALRMADQLWILSDELIQGTPKDLVTGGIISKVFRLGSINYNHLFSGKS